MISSLSLRARLVAVLLLLLSVALLVAGAATLAVLQRDLLARTDDELRNASQSTVLNALVDTATPHGSGRAPSPYEISVFTETGQLAVQLPSTAHPDELPRLDLATLRRNAGMPFNVSSVQRGGPTWRVLATPVLLSNRGVPVGPGTAVVAKPLDGVEGTLAQMKVRLVVIGVVVLAASALLGLAAVRRAFRPLREVESVATAFGEGDMSRRVQGVVATTEVGRLGAAVNAMLDSIESVLAAREASEGRMRRFVADASHELRTPVASVRGFAELYRLGAIRDSGDVARSFRRIEEEATRMGGLVEDLLLLARLDEQRPMRREPVDLLVLAADAVHDAAALAPERQVRLTGLDGEPVPRSAPTAGDEARLRQVLANLLTNAFRHTPAGTPVEIGVGAAGGWARWQVVDHGPGIPAEEAELIFERFYRADASRTRGSGGGSGLGLAIVSGISRAHGGAARVVPTPGGGATFEVAVPLGDSNVEDVEAEDAAADVEAGHAAADAEHRASSQQTPRPG